MSLLAECETGTSTRPGNDFYIPSWVPDWYCTRRREPLPGGLSQSSLSNSYRAGLNKAACFEYSVASPVLLVMGLVVDEIVFLEPRGRNLLNDARLTYILWQHVTFMAQGAAADTLFSILGSCDCSASNNHVSRMENLDKNLEAKKTDDPAMFFPARWPTTTLLSWHSKAIWVGHHQQQRSGMMSLSSQAVIFLWLLGEWL